MKGLSKSMFFNRSLFRKLLLSYLVSVLIPTLLIVSVYAYTNKEDIQTQIEQNSESKIQRVSKNIETVIDQINSFSLQLSFLPYINGYLQQSGEYDMYDVYQLKEQLRKHIVPNKLFHSVYLYSFAGNKVITTNDGIFAADEFYDQQAIQQIRDFSENQPWWYQVRIPPKEAFWNADSSDHDDEFVTFYRPVPVTAVKPTGILVFNIPKTMFLNTLYHMYNGSENDTVIIDGEGTVISKSGIAQVPELQTLTHELSKMPTNRMSRITWNKDAYFVRVEPVPYNGWSVVHLTPYQVYQERLLDKLMGLSFVVLLVGLIGLFVSYMYAVKMYHPWKSLIETLNGSGGKKPEWSAREDKDEFSLVRGAITTMLHTLKQNEPVIKDHLIGDILQNNLLDQGSIPSRLEQLGISFSAPGYLVMVVAVDPAAGEESHDPQHKLVMFSFLLETLKTHFIGEGTILDDHKFGFILNVNTSYLHEGLKERIRECYAEMTTFLQGQLNVSLQLCVSEVSPIERVHQSYERIRRALNYKAVMGSDEVIFVEEAPKDCKLEYPMSMQKHLLHTIVTLNRDKAEECIEELFEQYIYNSSYSHEKLQGMLVLLMGSIDNELLREGYDIWDLNEGIGILKLNDCRNNDQLRQFMSRHIQRHISHLQELENRKHMNRYTAKAIEYMEEHFAMNISITDIAEHVGISSGHLSRTFKTETGRSMLEYLTEFRVAKSKEMLVQRSDSLNEISQALGYNDVQSFIRFFKKFEGVTPGEYRKSMGKI